MPSIIVKFSCAILPYRTITAESMVRVTVRRIVDSHFKGNYEIDGIGIILIELND